MRLLLIFRERDWGSKREIEVVHIQRRGLGLKERDCGCCSYLEKEIGVRRERSRLLFIVREKNWGSKRNIEVVYI